jgi:hypothetical protein
MKAAPSSRPVSFSLPTKTAPLSMRIGNGDPAAASIAART